MANPWFRMYAEFATDPKVQRLSEVDQRRFLMILCLRCCNGDVTLHDSDVAFQLRITEEEWMKTKSTLVDRKLIDESNKPTAWDKRQFSSDSSKSRVYKHRTLQKQKCNGDVTLQKRPSNGTDTDTDTDTEKEKNTRALHVDGLDVDEWNRWVQYRKQIRKPLKPASIPAAQKALAAFGKDQAAVVEQSIANGWQGLFELKSNGAPQNETRQQVDNSAVARVRRATASILDDEPRTINADRVT